MIEYTHRKNDFMPHPYDLRYLKERRVKEGDKYYLVVLEINGENVVKGIVVKGRIDRWKVRKEKEDYVSDISFLSQLARKNKRYIRAKNNLEKRLVKRYKAVPTFC